MAEVTSCGSTVTAADTIGSDKMTQARPDHKISQEDADLLERAKFTALRLEFHELSTRIIQLEWRLKRSGEYPISDREWVKAAVEGVFAAEKWAAKNGYTTA